MAVAGDTVTTTSRWTPEIDFDTCEEAKWKTARDGPDVSKNLANQKKAKATCLHSETIKDLLRSRALDTLQCTRVGDGIRRRQTARRTGFRSRCKRDISGTCVKPRLGSIRKQDRETPLIRASTFDSCISLEARPALSLWPATKNGDGDVGFRR